MRSALLSIVIAAGLVSGCDLNGDAVDRDARKSLVSPTIPVFAAADGTTLQLVELPEGPRCVIATNVRRWEPLAISCDWKSAPPKK